jgi:hypothetical protein
MENGRQLRAARAIRFQARDFEREEVIRRLADDQVLPAFGFPINLQSLLVAGNESAKLQREAATAIREYSPESEVLVGGRVAESAGILKHWTGQNAQNDNTLGLNAGFAVSSDGDFHFSLEGIPNLGQGQIRASGQMVIVRHGYTTAASKKLRWGDSSKSSRAIQTYPARGSRTANRVDANFGGVNNLRLALAEQAIIFALNSGDRGSGFAVCTSCGYAASEVVDYNPANMGRQNLPSHCESHTPLWNSRPGDRCWPRDEAYVIRHRHLAARQVTDLVALDLSPWNIQIQNAGFDLAGTALALGQILRLAGCRLLQLDVRDVRIFGARASGEFNIQFGPFLCDTISGGAGHVISMAELGRDWLTAAHRQLSDSLPAAPVQRSRSLAARLLTADSPDAGALVQYDAEGALTVLEWWLGIQPPAAVPTAADPPPVPATLPGATNGSATPSDSQKKNLDQMKAKQAKKDGKQ